MCGIAGFIGTDSRLDVPLLARMQAALRHRGPDDRDAVCLARPLPGSKDPPLRMGMAHTRLSILDLTPAGRQPMSDPGQNFWICYNGEFYNSPKCRRELQQQGVDFHSRSDTEVLLHLCIRAGVAPAVARVNGMFAFSFFDRPAGALHLVRDRAGKKPLYYVHLPDGSLIYASEIPALLASGLVDPAAVDPQAVDQYWTLGYSMGVRTFYRQIRRVPPGSLATWQDGQLVIREYWQVAFQPADDSGKPLDAYADELAELLEDAVRLRLLSDVPVAICLSGGIDSALIAAMIARLRADVPAYTVSFAGTAQDETPYAAAVARHLKLPHRVLEVSGELSADFGRIAGWCGEPFGDPSVIPTYYLSQAIRRHATVALTGDGGDELFAGYRQYREGMRIWGGGRWAGDDEEARGRTRLRAFALRMIGLKRGYVRMQRHVNASLRRRLFTPAALASMDARETLAGRERWLERLAGAGDPLAQMQDCDFHTYLTDDVLMKVDRMAMAHALECRSPFLDYRIIEWAARLPARIKLSAQGEGKLVLRRVLSRFLPEELFRRPKQGFTPPWEHWCQGALRERLRADWRRMADPFLRPGAVDLLVPEGTGGSPILTWMAFSYATWRNGAW